MQVGSCANSVEFNSMIKNQHFCINCVFTIYLYCTVATSSVHKTWWLYTLPTRWRGLRYGQVTATPLQMRWWLTRHGFDVSVYLAMRKSTAGGLALYQSSAMAGGWEDLSCTDRQLPDV